MNVGVNTHGSDVRNTRVRKPKSSGKPSRSKAKRLVLPGKSARLVVIGATPLVAETPESLLDDDTTPTEKLFIRNNGKVPARTRQPDNWMLTVDGEVHQPLTISLGDLKARFKPVTRRLLLECGGNGRSFQSPPAEGVPWTNGGAGCPEWTGVRVADVLKAARLKPGAVFSGHYGADPSLDGTVGAAMSRGVPIAKLMDESNLIAFAINGEPLPLLHGFPVRLVIPGWPSSVSTKWLTRIWIRDRYHDGAGMGGFSYRVPVKPMAPGAKAVPKNFVDLESMPVRSIITSPADGAQIAAGTRALALRGAAWAGDETVAKVDLSIDGGATWQKADLAKPKNRHDWQRWTASLKIPNDGYYEILVRATDRRGVAQPFAASHWNPHGYGVNPMHRIAVTVGT